MKIYNEKKYEGKILKKITDVNDLFLATYHVAPYKGCEFECNYCDGLSHSDQPIDETRCSFSNFVKRLATELQKIDSKEIIGFTLGEPYQSAEKRYRLSRESLRLLGTYNQPALVLTKSPAILEDIDLLKWLNTRTLAIVAATIVTLNKTLFNHLECKAPLPAERTSMIEKLSHSGVPCGFALNPIIPFLTDDRKDLLNLLETLAKVKPDFIVWDYLWIPNECHKKQIKDLLQNIDDALIPKYDTLYQSNAQPSLEYRTSMNRFLIKACQSLGLEPRIPPKLYQNYLVPEKVVELIKRRDEFLSLRTN